MKECIVVMKPFSIPNSSFSTCATGARQLVVQDAAEITLSLDFKSFSFTPKTIFLAPLQGAETNTFFATDHHDGSSNDCHASDRGTSADDYSRDGY